MEESPSLQSVLSQRAAEQRHQALQSAAHALEQLRADAELLRAVLTDLDAAEQEMTAQADHWTTSALQIKASQLHQLHSTLRGQLRAAGTLLAGSSIQANRIQASTLSALRTASGTITASRITPD